MKDKYYVRQRRDKLSDHINKRLDPWSVASKKKLVSSIRHKIKRTFISALEAIDIELKQGSISEDVHKRLRSKILRAGNSQIEYMESEVDNRFNVEALNYHITMPVKPIQEGS
jgi:hypothetical protein